MIALLNRLQRMSGVQNAPVWLRRPVVTLVGVVLIAAGAVLLVLPGPGLLVIALGLAVLATEYPAAQRLLDRIKVPIAKARARWASRRA